MEHLIEAAHTKALDILNKTYTSKAERLVLASITKVEVRYSNRMQGCAGRATMYKLRGVYGEFHITLNRRLLSINLDQVEGIYMHELAHIVANLMIGGQAGHGPAWCAVMNVLGQPAERFHSMDTTAFTRPPVRFIYQCIGCYREINLTRPRHAKAQRAVAVGTHAYKCPKCYGKLVAKETQLHSQ